MAHRLRTMAMWAQLMIESIVYLFVPSCMAIQPSARYIIGRRFMKLIHKLSWEERSAIKFQVVSTGLSCIPAFMGLGFGLLGTRRPSEVFCTHGNSVKTIIIQKRLKNTCCICMCGYIYQQDVYVTPCKHCFHMACIAKWLSTKKECPVCRSGLPNIT
jgi:hypothetical protein